MAVVSAASTQIPPIGWTTPAKIVEVHDGDTVTIEVSRRMRVRLLDCWAPEVVLDRRVPVADQAAAKAAGAASREYLRNLVKKASPDVIVQIPTHSQNVGDVWTMDRVLGKIWLSDDKDRSISERMVAAGHATKTKEAWGASR